MDDMSEDKLRALPDEDLARRGDELVEAVDRVQY